MCTTLHSTGGLKGSVWPMHSRFEPGTDSLQALLLDTQDNQGTLASPAQAAQLLLLAEMSSACDASGDASPKAADAAAAGGNSEAVEGLLSALRSAEQLPGLLLGLVNGCVQQLRQADAPAGTEAGSELPEALPGEAPGCGELLNKFRQTNPW